MAGLEGPRKFLSYGALLLSAGACQFVTWPLYVGVSSGDAPYVLSLQQESLVILRVGQLDSKRAKQTLPDLLRAKPGNVTESLHPVGQSSQGHPDSGGSSEQVHLALMRMAGIVGGRPAWRLVPLPSMSTWLRWACLESHCRGAPGRSLFHSQMKFL